MNLVMRVSIKSFLENCIVDDFTSKSIRPKNSKFLLDLFNILNLR